MTTALPDRVIFAGLEEHEDVGLGLATGREVIDRLTVRGRTLIRRYGPERRRAAMAALSARAKLPTSPVMRWMKRVDYGGQYENVRARLERHGPAVVLCWNGMKSRTAIYAHAARDLGYPILYLEITPFTDRLSADFAGVNARNSLPRHGDFYLRWQEATGTSGLWQAARDGLRARVVTGSGVQQQRGTLDTGGERFIFVPLQVPGDSQVRIFGGWVGEVERMIELLAAASAGLPPGWHLRFKEHPSSRVSFSQRLKALEGPKFRIDNVTDTFEQVAASSAVLTLNSSVGLQSFLYEKPVVVLGEAFWGFAGNAVQAADAGDLARLMAAPETIRFDAAQRAAFLDFCLAEYFPKWDEMAAGRYRIDDVVARDARMTTLGATIR